MLGIHIHLCRQYFSNVPFSVRIIIFAIMRYKIPPSIHTNFSFPLSHITRFSYYMKASFKISCL